MDRPNQLPNSQPDEVRKKLNTGRVARFAAVAAIFILIGVKGFFRRQGISFHEASFEAPSFMRSAFAGMHEDRAILSALAIALAAILLSLTRLTNTGRALAFAALIFALVLAATTIYLIAAQLLA